MPAGVAPLYAYSASACACMISTTAVRLLSFALSNFLGFPALPIDRVLKRMSRTIERRFLPVPADQHKSDWAIAFTQSAGDRDRRMARHVEWAVLPICSQLCRIITSSGASIGGIFDAITRVVGINIRSCSESTAS